VSELHDHAYANMRDLEALQSRERLEGVDHDDAGAMQHVSEQAHAAAEFRRGRAELLCALEPETPDRKETHADEADRSLHALATSRRQLGVVDDATTRGLPLGSGSRGLEELDEREPLADLSLPPSAENGAVEQTRAPSRSSSSDDLEHRRSAQSYYDAGLPWTGEFEDLVNAGEVDVS
jgi:hypothetical protein